jgi:acyl-CoA reductase-like NAD-dependent aldehyde dehydrogenase
MARLELPDEILEDTEDSQVFLRYVPLGVAVAIVPWNCMPSANFRHLTVKASSLTC